MKKLLATPELLRDRQQLKHLRRYSQIAPSEADLTSFWYLPSTPLLKCAGIGSQPSVRDYSSPALAGGASRFFGTARRILSPSLTKAIGQESTASGVTLPPHSPV